MREYETTFIIQPEISEEGVGAICERLDGLLQKQKSVRLLYDDQGRRRLAYEISSFQKGRYLTLQYLDSGRVVPEIERSLRLDDSVLRFLTVLVDDDVADIEARKSEAAELERVRAEKAAERAAREAEEAERLAASEAAAAEVAKAAEAAEATKAAEAAEKAEDGADADDSSDADGETQPDPDGDGDGSGDDADEKAED